MYRNREWLDNGDEHILQFIRNPDKKEVIAVINNVNGQCIARLLNKQIVFQNIYSAKREVENMLTDYYKQQAFVSKCIYDEWMEDETVQIINSSCAENK